MDENLGTNFWGPARLKFAGVFMANTVVICGLSTELVTLQIDYDSVKLERATPKVSCWHSSSVRQHWKLWVSYITLLG